MSSFTTIGKGHGSPCIPATQPAWIEARQAPDLADLCQRIEQTTNPDSQKRLKDRLPVWTPRCGAFRDNHRAEKDAICPLNRQMFDIDEKGHTDQILALMQPDAANPENMKIGDFIVLMVEESVRRGTHVLVIPPAGRTLNEAQAQFSDLIGLPVDPAVKNVAGCIYMVPDDHVRYLSPRFYEAEANMAKATAEKAVASAEKAVASAEKAVASSFEETYDGIPYSILVESLADQLGGVPVHGSRNNFIFSMACHLRYVCNDDPQWIGQVLPTYGEDKDRVMRTIQSACNRAQSRYVPQLVQRAISVARAQCTVRGIAGTASATAIADRATNIYCSPIPPEFPKNLPRLIQLLVSKVDPMYRPAVAQAVFPPLGAHLHGVRTRYIDNSEADLGGFFSVLMAKQSIGKGSVNMPIDLIMDDIRQRDDYSRELEKQWKQQCKSAKSTEKKPPRPEGLCVQYLMSNMTNAALVQRLIDAEAAGNKFLYVRLDEIELLDQIKATGGATASEIIRLAHNQALYGQERVGTEAVTGTPPLRFNFNASTTIPAGQQYFSRGLTNGTLSRITLSTIIRPAGIRGIPRFGNYDEQFRKQLAPYINNLNAATGLIECRQAERLAERLYDENNEISELSDDDVFETLSFRSCRIAHDKAKLLYIAQGYQWDKSIADFCRWSMQYDLWLKLHFFGQQMRQLLTEQKQPVISGPQNMLDLLPNRFTRQDLQAVHRAQGKEGDFMRLVYTWTNRGYIEQDTTTCDFIKTEKYLRRHKSNLS